jgi:hypothetical protein
MAMHWWTLIVGILLGACVLPMITKALGGMSGKSA